MFEYLLRERLRVTYETKNGQFLSVFQSTYLKTLVKPSWTLFNCLIGSLDRVLGPVIKKSRVQVSSFSCSSSFQVQNMHTLPRPPLSHIFAQFKTRFIYSFIYFKNNSYMRMLTLDNFLPPLVELSWTSQWLTSGSMTPAKQNRCI